MHKLLANALQYLGYYQMKELAHTCANARDTVRAWLCEHPWVTSPLEDVFARSSLTLLMQISRNIHGKNMSLASSYMPQVGKFQNFICLEEILARACKYDDVDLVHYIVQDILNTYGNVVVPIDKMQCACLLIASMPVNRAYVSVHDHYQNKTQSARVFMYLIGMHKCARDVIELPLIGAPIHALRTCPREPDSITARDIIDLFNYIGSGAVMTSNEKLLRNLMIVCDLRGLCPAKYYSPGFSGQISPRTYELACSAGMQMSREYDAIPSILALAALDIKDGEAVTATITKHTITINQCEFYSEYLIARGRNDLIKLMYAKIAIPDDSPYYLTRATDIHSQTFVSILREIAEYARRSEWLLRYVQDVDTRKEYDDDWVKRNISNDVLCQLLISGFHEVLTIPLRTIRRVLDDTQYVAYMSACAITFLVSRNNITDLAYLREFDRMRIPLRYSLIASDQCLHVMRSTCARNIDHNITDAILDMHAWMIANPNTRALPHLVQACITAHTPCDTKRKGSGKDFAILGNPNIHAYWLVHPYTKRDYVSSMDSTISEIVNWSGFAHLSAFEQFALGVVFDDVLIMRESHYQIKLDTFLGAYIMMRAIDCHVALTFDMLDVSVRTNAHHLCNIIDRMSIGNVLTMLRSMPEMTLLELMNKEEGMTAIGLLADVILSTERY